MLKSLLIAAATVAITALLVVVDPLLLQAFKALAPQTPGLVTIAEALEHVLDPPVVLLGIIAYALVFRAARWRRFWILLGTAFTQGILVSKLKCVFSRMRPDDLTASFGFFGPMWHGEHNSFPGGHAAGAFALAALFARWHPRWKWAIYSAATVVTLARIYINRHFFSDCFIGASLGYWIAQTFLYYSEPRHLPAPPQEPAAFLEVQDGDEPA